MNFSSLPFVVVGVIAIYSSSRVLAKTCAPVPAFRHVVLESCSYLNEKVNCDDTLNPNSTAIARCTKGYRSINSKSSEENVYCSDDGTWKNLPSCIDECGKLGSSILRPRASVISTPALRGLFAWHVAIYRLDGNPVPICSGTIVSSQMILSAAHCFRKEKESGIGYRINDVKSYAFAVAKSTRDYYTEDSSYTKFFKIRKIILMTGNKTDSKLPMLDNDFSPDIAILLPETALEFYRGDVFPACVDWSESADVPAKITTGEVYGWGLNEYNLYSEYLVHIKIPRISQNECKKAVFTHERTSQDKLCATSESGAKLRICDSGGGLMVWNPRESRYYVKGIVSARINRQNNTSMILFTDLSRYITWIRGVQNKILNDPQGSLDFNDEDLEDINNGISIRFGENDNNAGTSSESTNNIKPAPKNQCALPRRSSTLKYAIKKCEDGGICQKKSGDYVPPDTGLFIQCIDLNGEFVQFDSFCVLSKWRPSMKSCKGVKMSTRTNSSTIRNVVLNTSHQYKDNLNRHDDDAPEVFVRLKELLLTKMRLIIGMFLL